MSSTASSAANILGVVASQAMKSPAFVSAVFQKLTTKDEESQDPDSQTIAFNSSGPQSTFVNGMQYFLYDIYIHSYFKRFKKLHVKYKLVY